MDRTKNSGEAWPPLPAAAWEESRTTLHMWTQIVGKIRLALAPHVNHWWQVPLYVSSRGLTTTAMPYDRDSLTLEFDFLDHVLDIISSRGGEQEMALGPRSVADFYGELMGRLDEMGMPVRILARPVEVVEATPFAEDQDHNAYDGEAVERFWQVLMQADRVLNEFRGAFTGKASPVQYFWGSFDLAASRFSGRTAPPHPGGMPNVGDWVMREAYSHEVSSAGFWPGSMGVDASFYSYAYPAPPGYAEASVVPQGAYYHETLGEFVLPYEAVRQADSPETALRAFLDSTYEAAAELGNWDRAALERQT
jgi:hypothetical protein